MRSDPAHQQWQRLPEKRIRRLQAEKLKRYLRDVVIPFSAHYRRLFKAEGLDADAIRSLEDLRKLPFTSKADLLNTPDNPNAPEISSLFRTSKTLGRRPSTLLRG
jgi:phenylacetate-coenzyme A ligase PaaK-like adenylate-forming protein